MEKVFRSYGKYYDIIYSDKDYERECNFLEEIFRKYSNSMPKAILDAGCGTGGHAIPLAKSGYKVTGIDASEVMINIAKKKAKENEVSISLHVMDLRNFQLNQKFDACISMFAVIGYLTKKKDTQRALFNIRKHLKNDSLFIFDFWYGPAVLTILPSVREKVVEDRRLRVTRFAKPHLDISHKICEVDYHLMITKGNQIIDNVREKHVLRFYFPGEVRHHLEDNGFKLLKLCPFLDLNAEPSENTWNVTAISKAIKRT